jgi:hypothetical protein
MRPVVSNDRGLRRLARSTTTTALLIAVAGCGSSSDHAAKQARIAGALNKLEREVVAGNRELRRKFRGKDLLGGTTLVYARPPPRREQSGMGNGDEARQAAAAS